MAARCGDEPTLLNDFYLKLGDLRGDGTRCPYEGWFELLSFSFGPSMAGSSRPAASQPHPKCTEAHFSKRSDRASNALFLAAATGKPFPSARLVMTGPATMTVLFEDVTLTHHQINQVINEPVESVSFRFRKAKTEFDVRRER